MNALVFQSSKVTQEPVELSLIILVIRLVLKETLAFVRKRECSEQEGLDWEGEVPVLCFLAVFVHSVSDDGEVNRSHQLGAGTCFRFQDEFITFAVTVREHNHHHTVDDLLLLDVSELLT